MAICKFCGKRIVSDHYFVSKQGSVCLECKENIAKDVKSFGIINDIKDGSNNSSNNSHSVVAMG